MKNLEWQCRSFQHLSNILLYEIIKLRVDIFVVEQQCPYPELDNKDTHLEAFHITAHSNSILVAYARLLPPGLSYPEASMGRFVVDRAFRHQGIGSQLITKCLEEINKRWPNCNIKISAQEHLKEFYENYGFTKISDCYLEDEIPHIAMLKDS